MKRIIFILGSSFALVSFAYDSRAYDSCAQVCTIEITRADCLADCANGMIEDPMAMLSTKDTFKVVTSTPEEQAEPQFDRATSSVDSHELGQQGFARARSASIIMVTQAVGLITSNPSPAEKQAASHLLQGAVAEAAQMRAHLTAANKNWEQCLLLKGNSDGSCGSAPQFSDEFIVTPALASQLETLGIGRLEFQGKFQAGDWDWIREALGMEGADIREEEMRITHAYSPEESPSEPLTAETIVLSNTPHSTQALPPNEETLREAGIIILEPGVSLFHFASRKFTRWQKGAF
jgi:hypothetical protein